SRVYVAPQLLRRYSKAWCLICGIDRTKADVAIGNLVAGLALLHIGRDARARAARAAPNTGLLGVLGGGVVRVEPQHVGVVLFVWLAIHALSCRGSAEN